MSPARTPKLRFPHAGGGLSKPEEFERSKILTDVALRLIAWIPGQAREVGREI